MHKVVKRYTVTPSHTLKIPKQIKTGAYIEVTYQELEVIKPGTTNTNP